MLKANIRKKNKVITAEDIFRLKKELLHMDDIAGYMKVVDEAHERHYKREEKHLDAGQDALREKKKRIIARKWGQVKSSGSKLLKLFQQLSNTGNAGPPHPASSASVPVPRRAWGGLRRRDGGQPYLNDTGST